LQTSLLVYIMALVVGIGVSSGVLLWK